ncbi:MAG: hypothetical protein ABI873_12400 [Marmoricola sp.]
MSSEPDDANEARLIPYAGKVEGPTRRLDLLLRKSPTLSVKPGVAIDGQFHDLEWGRVAFEVPADRTVRVEVWMYLNRQLGWASYALEAREPAALEYLAPAAARYSGQLGPVGTLKRKGRLYLGCMLTFLLLALLPLLGILVLVVAALFR